MTRQGFTLIELLVVLVVLAILAAFAVNKVNSVKETAYVTTMKADLRNLVLAEEAYFQDSSAYAKKVSCGKKVSSGSAIFCTSAGNTLGTITVVKAKVPNKKGKGGKEAAWTASIASAHTGKRCAIYVGDVTPAAPATTSDPPGVPVCQ